ncbi:hypothetical protein MRX96_017033 [Rhipicephalus microplus]
MDATEHCLKKIFHQQRKILPLKTAFSLRQVQLCQVLLQMRLNRTCRRYLTSRARHFPLKTAFSLDTSLSDGLKYVRSYKSTHHTPM